MVAGIEKKARAQIDAKPTAPRIVRHRVKQNWDCSQIENGEEEEDEDWQKCEQMEMHWVEEDEKLQEIFEQERKEVFFAGRSLAKRYLNWWYMSGCPKVKKAKGMEEKKKVRGWMRSVSQEEMDQCWKKLAENIEEEVLDKYLVYESKRGAYRGRGSLLGWRRVRKSRKYRIREW